MKAQQLTKKYERFIASRKSAIAEIDKMLKKGKTDTSIDMDDLRKERENAAYATTLYKNFVKELKTVLQQDNITNLIETTTISRTIANDIAASQFDLGVKSQEDMVIALCGGQTPETQTNEARMEAFNRLDNVSQFIVQETLEGYDKDEELSTTHHLRHVIAQITNALNACDNEMVDISTKPGEGNNLFSCDLDKKCQDPSYFPKCGTCVYLIKNNQNTVE